MIKCGLKYFDHRSHPILPSPLQHTRKTTSSFRTAPKHQHDFLLPFESAGEFDRKYDNDSGNSRFTSKAILTYFFIHFNLYFQNTKVFIGSLPPGAKPQELRRLFENFGVVTECDIMNRCGFVHMENAEVAEKAIQGLNNSYFMGQTISVEPGRMKERRAPMGGRGGVGEEGGAPRGGRLPYSRGGGGGGSGDGYSNGFQRGGPNSRISSNNNIDLGGGGPIRRSNLPARNVPYARYGGHSSNGGGSSGGGGAATANGYERRNYYGGSKLTNRIKKAEINII